MTTKQETFDALKTALASVTADLQGAEAEISAHTAEKTDGKTLDGFGRLQSKSTLLTARKMQIEATLPAAELDTLREVVALRNADLAEAIKAHADVVSATRERLIDLFEPQLIERVVSQSKPVREAATAISRINELVMGASSRCVRFAEDHGLK